MGQKDQKKISSEKRQNRRHIGTTRIGIFLTVLICFRAFPSFAQSPINITFGSDEAGKFPSGWQALDKNNAVKVYSVRAEGGKKFLHADSKGSREQIGYEKKWVLKDFPIFQWQWRPVLFPAGTNEREKNGNDSVLGLYVIFGHWPFLKVIKYIWSDTLPVGASLNSPFSNDTRILVLRSGRSLMGTWVQERRNVLSDYHQLFGEGEKNPVATGIGVLTDSDNTNSHAIGDYADFQALAYSEPAPQRP
jgi:hypothetical protein